MSPYVAALARHALFCGAVWLRGDFGGAQAFFILPSMGRHARTILGALLGAFLLVILIAFVGEIVLAGLFSALSDLMRCNPLWRSDRQIPRKRQRFSTRFFTPQHPVIVGVAYAILLALNGHLRALLRHQRSRRSSGDRG